MDRFTVQSSEQTNLIYKITKNIPYSEPFRTHKIFNLADDFYTNLITWSKENIAYGVNNKLFIFNYHTCKNELIYEYTNKSITSVYYNSDGTKLSVGCTQGKVDVLDLNSMKNKTYKVHRSRIGVIEWYNDLFYTGSRDKTIKMVDERAGNTKTTVSFHLQEVCGLKLNCTKEMLASGGNDNNIFIYDSRMLNECIYSIKSHKAAIKALSWSKRNPNLLVSGGGTADKSIKLWCLKNKPKLLKNIDSNSQVCNLYWTETNKVISTHGYSQNDSRIYSSNLCMKDVNRGHRNRIIHFAVNDTEEYYLTGSADCLINIWKVPESIDTHRFR
ncbi:hypothetical protein H312_02581 [Anncaliia algerae PRA339]|uniref:CDC20/Fizzy WD40 domain-containing protein n=1 Tax=Anncaliia algerae PRA339 TaxID=1288291 RepID=A0A059EZ66_9MICR|nr:hypothetical protein H312_02581 [Anncaliia algerae PRA339]